MTGGRPPQVRCIVVECDLEAVALRAFLDCATRADVTLRGVATSYQLTDELRAAGRDADYVVVTCHGDEDGIIFEELAPGVLTPDQPCEARVGPKQIRSRVHLSGQPVICTGCGQGTEAMAEAFVGAGSSHYIAAAGDPEGWAAPLLLTLLFHELLVARRPVPEAMQRATAYDDELRLFHLWSAGQVPQSRRTT
ncbi:MAG: hypothetical protein AB7Y46_15385 [Armatimonadota bacterium]